MKENIAFILPRLSNGGMERVAAALSKEISEKYNLTIISLLNDKEKYNFSGDIVTINGVIGENIFEKIFNFFYRLRKIKKLKKEKKINLTLSFEQTCNFLNLLSGNDKKVISIHSVKSKENLSIGIYGKIYNFIMRKIYKRADGIICVSQGIKKDLIENYNLKELKKINVINNPYDISFIEKNINHKKVFEEFTLINVGRLNIAKGQKNLLKIVSLVKKKFPKIKLKILGKGELEEDLKKLSRSLSLEENVEFMGYVNNPYLEIEKANIFVLTSLYEGFPGVLVESLVCKTPVISTDCTYGIREILLSEKEINEIGEKDIEKPFYGEYGVICPKFKEKNMMEFSLEYTEEEKVFSEEIIKFLNSKELRKKYQENGIRKAYKLDTSIISKKYEKLFEKILKN